MLARAYRVALFGLASRKTPPFFLPCLWTLTKLLHPLYGNEHHGCEWRRENRRREADALISPFPHAGSCMSHLNPHLALYSTTTFGRLLCAAQHRQASAACCMLEFQHLPPQPSFPAFFLWQVKERERCTSRSHHQPNFLPKHALTTRSRRKTRGHPNPVRCVVE